MFATRERERERERERLYPLFIIVSEASYFIAIDISYKLLLFQIFRIRKATPPEIKV